MKIVLVVPMRNEIEYGDHVHMQMDSALSMDYDNIVVLDDGSTDGTWDVLKEYANKDNRVKVFRSERNSIISKGQNRWKTLVDYAAKLDPTWIHFRAADQLHSKIYNEEMRKIIEFFHDKGASLIRFPLAHLWRSKWWYRADNVWGRDVVNQNKFQLWRFDKSYKYNSRKSRAVFHGGQHLPSTVRYHGSHVRTVNEYIKRSVGNNNHKLIVVLHYGHTTHRKKEVKFRLTMQAAAKGMSMGCPGPANMPPVKDWLRYNGYKGFWEFNMVLKRCPQVWFDEPIPENIQKPEIKSFYNVINEFRADRAAEYQYLFDLKMNAANARPRIIRRR